MIVPIVGEDAWQGTLDLIPEWDPGSDPILLIAPHPDDETLGTGGLIAAQRERGVAVTVVAVTDGEHAYDDTDPLELARERRKEQMHALAWLGVEAKKIVRLGLADSAVSARENDLVQSLLPLISANTHVLAPWAGDFHPDHEACGRAAAEAARQRGARVTSYFFWTWHRGEPLLLDSLKLGSFRLNEEQQRAKAEALLCHRTQLKHPSGKPILPENLLGPARRPFEVFVIA